MTNLVLVIREVRVLVNVGMLGGPAHVYVRDDNGWYHLVVGELEEVGDVRRYVTSGDFLAWPREAPPA